MADDIGSVKGITGTSMALNNQPGPGAIKPSATGGNADPGGTKPKAEKDTTVHMPK